MRKYAERYLLTLLLILTVPAAGLAGQSVQLSTAPGGVTVLNERDNGLTLKMTVGTLEFNSIWTKGGDFTLLTAGQFTQSQRLGEPAVPMANRLIAIPAGCDLKLNVISSEIEEISLTDLGITEPLMPVQPSLSKSDDPMAVPFYYEESSYQQDNFYAQPLAETGVAGTMRGLRLAMVSFSPVEYNPVQNKLRVYKSITVEIDFDHADWGATADNYLKTYSPYFEPVYDQILNYSSDFAGVRADLTKYPVKYLIISDRMFETELEPFIEWKTQKGFDVITAYTDVIGTSNTAIKAYIQGLYNSASPPEDPAPSFVLFVGDAAQIPPFSGSAGSHITDLRFCEFTGDDFPEIYYGRFSAQNTAQLIPQINKTLEYERYEMPDPSYLQYVTLVSGVDPSYAATHGNGQINYGTTYYFNVAHGIDPNVWLYPASDAGGAAADIIQTVSDGIGLYNYTAHCSHTGHADPSFTTADIPGLTNYHKYLLGIGNCCLSNTFADNYSDCFGEAFLKVADKGGIGYIGGTNSTYWYEDYYWGVGYGPVVASGPTYEQTTQGAYDGVFHEHGEPETEHYVCNSAIIFAGNLAVTASGSSREQYYWEIYHLMGDPSVITYLGVPAANAVVYDPTVLMTATDITVEADPGSYVGISVDGVLQGSGRIDASGTATIPLVGFTEPCEAQIVITGQNRIPHIGTLQVITPSGPYVVYNTCDIDDAAGNGNGLIEPTETIVLGVGLKNVGPDTAYGVTADITTTDPYVTITDGTEEYGTIDPDNGTGYSGTAFTITVSADIPDGHRVSFDLEVNGTNRATWYGSFNVTAHAPVVEFVSVSINDAAGDNNGILDPGETAALTLTLSNSGSGQAFQIDAYISETDDMVSIGDDYGYFGLIDSIGGTASNSVDVYEITALEDCPLGYAVPITVDVSGDNGYTNTLYFNITVGDRVVFYYDDFALDMGWTGLGGTAEWQMGSPSGAGGDPSADHTETTDNMVLGNDLGTSGQYNSGISGTQWVSSPLIDCGTMSGVIMTYYHWLGVESSSYDHAYLQVFDGTDWVELYSNPSSTFQESEWVEEVYDLSAVADSNPNFQIRFGLGSTDYSGQYSGWNIDDIELRGYGRIGLPQMEMDEAGLSDSLQPNASSTKNVTVRNVGEGTLRVWFSSDDTWLDFSTDMVVLFPTEELAFPVTIDAAGLACGTHTGSLNYTSNDAGSPEGSIPVLLHIYAPAIDITEESITASMESGDQHVHPLTISNNGPGELTFQIGCTMYEGDKAPENLVAAAPAVSHVDPIGYRPSDADKSDAQEAYYPAQTKSFGGPDVWGHSWIDSDEAGGPVFGWVDISATGTEVILGDDESTDAIALGFDFPFYDSVYSEIYIGSNGMVGFDGAVPSRINGELPNDSWPAIIPIFWDDIDPRKGGHIYYDYDAANGRFIVSYNDVMFYYSSTGTGQLNMQVLIYPDGIIKLQYGTMDPGDYAYGLESATIGIQNSDADDALQVVNNAAYMHSNLAIEITAQHWLSVVPAGGVIAPFGNTTVDVTFDGTEMEDGEYTGMVVVSCNDPMNPSMAIPVTLTIASWLCGDINGSGDGPDIEDLVFLVDYFFNQGPTPPNMLAVDLDGDPGISIGDVVHLVEFMFNSGPDLMCQ